MFNAGLDIFSTLCREKYEAISKLSNLKQKNIDLGYQLFINNPKFIQIAECGTIEYIVSNGIAATNELFNKQLSMKWSAAGGYDFRFYTERDNIDNAEWGCEQLNTVQGAFPRCMLTAEQIILSTVSPDDYVYASTQVMFGNKFIITDLINPDGTFISKENNNNAQNVNVNKLCTQSSDPPQPPNQNKNKNIFSNQNGRVLTQDPLILNGQCIEKNPLGIVEDNVSDNNEDDALEIRQDILSQKRENKNEDTIIDDSSADESSNDQDIDIDTDDKHQQASKDDADEINQDELAKKTEKQNEHQIILDSSDDEWENNDDSNIYMDEQQGAADNHNGSEHLLAAPNTTNASPYENTNNKPTSIKGTKSSSSHRSYSRPSFAKTHGTRAQSVREEQEARCKLKLDIDASIKILDKMIMAITIKPFWDIFNKLRVVSKYIDDHQRGDTPCNVGYMINQIIGELNPILQKSILPIQFATIGDRVNGDIFIKYDNVAKAIGQNKNALQMVQHLGGYTQCLLAKSIGHKRKGGSHRVSTTTPLTAIVPKGPLRKRINANMYFGYVVDKYPCLFVLNMVSTQYQANIATLLQILDNNEEQILDENYDQFPWDDTQQKRKFSALYVRE